MRIITCLGKKKNNNGVITQYKIADKNNVMLVTPKQLKEAIKSKKVECINLKLTADNRLIDKKPEIEVKSSDNISIVKESVLKARELHIEIPFKYKNGLYVTSGCNISLKECLVKDGTFIIPSFVTDFVSKKEGNISYPQPFLNVRNLKLINHSELSDFSRLFFGSKVVNLDLSKFDAKGIKNMEAMFQNCRDLENLNVGSMVQAGVENVSGMFCNCSKLTKLDVSKFDTSSVTNMSAMFYGCGGLKKLNLSNFDTSNVTDMHSMFAYCIKLENLDLSNFNMSKVIKKDSMFARCNKLNLQDVNVDVQEGMY